MSSAKWRPFCLGLNVLSASSIMKQNLNSVITVTADALAPNSARPSAGTTVTTQLYIVHVSFIVSLAFSDFV